jgi:lipoprotein-anchoring transpeptidase ErfK/SrfK
MAILTAAAIVVAVPEAEAALFYWQDPYPGYYRPAPTAQPRRQRTRRPSAKSETTQREASAKPQGPLIIAVSVDQQRVRVYDGKGLFAESPVSTGMRGHSTPMGVFSIIQKNKKHRSNIYSGAPMPYMQRITWSGIALHAGVLPGYPASHGCIRMPMAFAMKMWNWTRMGARVIITPGEITPAAFGHPLLVAQKVRPQPLIADEPNMSAPAVKGDKGADAGSTIRFASPNFANAHASLELRSTVGHAASLREQFHTADASSALKAGNTAATISDAGASIGAMQADDKPAEAKGLTPPEARPDEVTAVAPAVEPAGAAEAKADPANEDKAAPKAGDKAEDKPVAAVAATPAPLPDMKKDTSRLPGAEKAVVAKPEPPMRPGQIAVFVSRKDSKLYVRENFKPQFDVPVTIAPSDRPLGTHVFTAEADKNDSNILRWSVISLPVTARSAARIDEAGRSAPRRSPAGVAPAETRPVPTPNNPAEALDRITIAPDAMARIAEALTTGSSIVVSDLGVSQGGETGEGTDFIVPLR